MNPRLLFVYLHQEQILTAMTREEAIKVIKEAMPTLWKETKDAIQTLIPELAESEDERIRKEIISIVKEYGRICEKEGDPCSTINDCLSYLENLKPSFRQIHDSVAWDNGLRTGIELEKQKEQKEIVQWPNLSNCKHDCKTCFAKCIYRKEQNEEQKPAEDWREDRKKECPFRRILDNNLYGCEQYAGVVCACDGNCSWVVDYPKLKEIQDRKEQKPAEQNGATINGEPIPTENQSVDISLANWSEEDEIHRTFILESLEDQIRFCKKDAEGAHYAKQIRTAQNWLKSLPTFWKPSEQEKSALRTAILILTERNFPKTTVQLQNILNTFEGEEPRKEQKFGEEEIGALNYAYCELLKRKDVGHNILGPLQKLCDKLRNYNG